MTDPQNASDPSTPEKGPGCPPAGRTAVAGPGLATTPGSPTGGPVGAVASEPAVDVCGFVHDQWDIVRMRRRCIASAGHSRGLFAYDHGPWERVPNRPTDSALDAPPSPPAARLSAEERPEAAGEPEAAGDGVAGYEAARGRRALTMREIRVALGHRVDFDGCNSECRKAQKHTFRWGGCEHAVKPEPTVSLSRIYTAPDGYSAIGFDRFTTAELAELIEPALHAVGIRLGPNALAILQDGHEVRLSSGEITRLALAAADAIVTHSNRDAT